MPLKARKIAIDNAERDSSFCWNDNYPEFHQRLQHWYSNHGRHDLPWRHTDDPYAIYLSEIMLQQTQVKTVLERFYFPFLKQFPTLAALARAAEQDVLKAWEGMGYYRRAKNLHATAKILSCSPLEGEQRRTSISDVRSMGGKSKYDTPHDSADASSAPPQGGSERIPSTIDALMALPGIGRNTAHAVAAFAYKHPVPVMEANVKRVIHRIFALKKAKDEELWEKAFELLDRDNPYDYNQAMMDVGSMICTPVAPDCPNCPANVICQGQENPEAFPEKVAKKKMPAREKNIVVFHAPPDQYFLASRESALLGGLYAFPEVERERKKIVFQGKHYVLKKAQMVGQVSHVYSHFRLEADVYLIPVQAAKGMLSMKEVLKLPLSGVEKKILALLS